MEMRGRVSSGLGRAHVFMAQPHYQDQFKVVLGVTAWPGTLNLEVSGESFIRYLALRENAEVETTNISEELEKKAKEIDTSTITSHRIDGFEREGRSFGGATAFLASINYVNGNDNTAIECAILIPDLTRHTDVVEVIASAFLREAFDLQDGDELTIRC
ncbi:MAG TPA: DUF120 domain-containing protein [Candidatus Thalassarchaeaceae archaeon]|nr:CTP-dependent riboflavin kinase [Candidatus Thalassarchaeaceae archaeon]HJL59915.1 DUF120 domain-containing protein [Candidatus Thalassarchaeaceae archaeon]